MGIVIGIILLIVIGYFLFTKYAKKKYDGFLKFYDGIQKNTIKEANENLNKHLLEFSNNPTEELGQEIFHILSQNQSYIILTFIDNKDPNDNKTFSLTNSINFRKIKNGDIGAFTDFDIMRNYVGDYVSFPKVRPVKNRKQGKVLLILNGRKNEKDPIYRDSNCNHVEAT